MSHRFFLDSIPNSDNLSTGDKISLKGDQAHHAINVMRFNLGDQIVLFDGSGIEYLASVDAIEKKSFSVTVTQAIDDSKSLATQISIAVALPKGDRQKFLIEKMVELGVHSLIPLKTTRAVAVANPKVIARLKKQVVEASKQSGRNKLMEIAEPQTINQMNCFAATTLSNCRRLVADPYQGKPIAQLASQGENQFLIAIGPEGGFDQSEVQFFLDNEFQPMTLGPSILRTETACVATAAILGVGKEPQDVRPAIERTYFQR